MANSTVTYVILIATTTEKLWQALTSAEALRKNWGIIESPWTVGSKVTEVDGSGKLLWHGQVTRSEPPRLLSFTMAAPGTDEGATETTFELDRPVSKVA